MDEICDCGHKVNHHFISNSGCSIEGCHCRKPILKIQEEKIAALRSLLSDAMKALEPVAKEWPASVKREGINEDCPLEGCDLTYGDFRTAADVWARIKAKTEGGK